MPTGRDVDALQIEKAIQVAEYEHVAAMITPTSATHRRGAHQLYESLGYDGNGVRFKKWLRAE
jgi:hypothetical protein